MASSEVRVTSSEKRVASGKLRVASGELRVASCELASKCGFVRSNYTRLHGKLPLPSLLSKYKTFNFQVVLLLQLMHVYDLSLGDLGLGHLGLVYLDLQ